MWLARRLGRAGAEGDVVEKYRNVASSNGSPLASAFLMRSMWNILELENST